MVEMAKFIEQVKGLTVGYAALGYRGGVSGSVKQQVHDGDTINVRAIGNFGVRFLGVDAPEISFVLPGETGYTGLSSPKWEEFLGDPFAKDLPPFKPSLDAGLRNYLKAKSGPGAAMNHYRHAAAAEDALEEEVRKDIEELGQTEESFRYFLVFCHEIMDRYGRLLCFINRDQPDPEKPGPRPISYNERLLRAGKVCPYFVWPNVNPFRKAKSLLEAVIPPGTAKDTADGEKTLREARTWVRESRKEKVGVF
ncbi:MAG: hypothetical protein QXF24_06060, partial [Thermoproteota archaeon]